MKQLYVAWQDEESREWIPVAILQKSETEYQLQYTRGASRCASFSGLGRMTALDKVYYSKTLFPFFANRLISKSRPEYKSYFEWLGLDAATDDSMSVLSITGGIRATDSFELVATPKTGVGEFSLDFFSRGLRYLPPLAFSTVEALKTGSRLYLMRDIQNLKDPGAIAIRTEDHVGL